MDKFEIMIESDSHCAWCKMPDGHLIYAENAEKLKGLLAAAWGL